MMQALLWKKLQRVSLEGAGLEVDQVAHLIIWLTYGLRAVRAFISTKVRDNRSQEQGWTGGFCPGKADSARDGGCCLCPSCPQKDRNTSLSKSGQTGMSLVIQ